MKLVLILAILLTLWSCKENLHDSMLKKIEIFERNESKFFENTEFQPLNSWGRQKQLDLEFRRRGVFGNARFQTSPDQVIYKNFPHWKDSIELDLLRVIDSLKVGEMYNYADTTQLKFRNKGDYIILYRENLYYKLSYFGNPTPTVVIDDWKYFRIERTAR